MKNLCQVCLLDLQFGLPAQVRDSVMPAKQAVPMSDVSREYMTDLAERAIAEGRIGYQTFSAAQSSELLQKLARDRPYYKRNLPRVCTFFTSGTCNRGKECPYRHIIPEEQPGYDPALQNQNFKDRYYGNNDPVAEKMLRRAGGGGGGPGAAGACAPPADKSITSLWVGGVRPPIEQRDMYDTFSAYGEIREVRMIPASQCCFVHFIDRETAEKAAAELAGKTLEVRGMILNWNWGKARKPRAGHPPMATTATTGPYAGIPMPPGMVMPGASAAMIYPSMNPTRMGARGDTVDTEETSVTGKRVRADHSGDPNKKSKE
eukprot:CAMPEP_0177637022 /NCGR_PEP_ID=MMETSP0447-20121125/4753_1 /TAXON_ID=0 /ORGANISM="Stygamoeba regulata, Strain BSH-02190019" /LENGTH=317 /DNA_ID=CAMNT_0019138929 /DNA_START=257 /DNA_END=1210 /DNA_ORIENTATION=-